MLGRQITDVSQARVYRCQSGPNVSQALVRPCLQCQSGMSDIGQAHETLQITDVGQAHVYRPCPQITDVGQAHGYRLLMLWL